MDKTLTMTIQEIRVILTASVLNGLLSKYKLNEPRDQEIVARLAVEIADETIKKLGYDILMQRVEDTDDTL